MNKLTLKLSKDEQELFDLFLEEYNDLFEKFLLISEKNYFDDILKNVEIVLTSKVFNSYSKISIAKIQSLLKKDYYIPDKTNTFKIKELFLSGKQSSIPHLSKEEVIPHCNKTEKIYHLCGEELVKPLNFDYILCLNCKNIYKPTQIHCFCKECNKEYFTYINNEEEKDCFKATWENYHCNDYYSDGIRCPKCQNILYYNKNDNIIFCKKCSFQKNINKIKYICEYCNNYFYSNCRPFTKFELKPLKNSIKLALKNKEIIRPAKISCNCDLNLENVEFFHSEECDGVLLKGKINNKIITVCNKCQGFNFIEKVVWICPKCKKKFYYNKIYEPKKKVTISSNINNNKKKYIDDEDLIFENLPKHQNFHLAGAEMPIKNVKTSYYSNFKNNFSEKNILNKNNNNFYFDTKEKKLKTNYEPKNKQKNININMNVNININNYYSNIEPDENFDPNDFQIIKQIGGGTFGIIYEAKWKKNSKTYALKKINLPKKEDYSIVHKEYDIILSFLKQFPNEKGIIKVFGCKEEKYHSSYQFYVLMEYAFTDWEKEILYRKERKNFYTEGELIDILKTLIKTFANLQKLNISHRDIKPQNILKVGNEYKICDFGEASIIGKDDDLYTLRGTELYMSPILFQSLKNNQGTCKHNLFKSDVFSLGMCMILASTLTFNSLYDIRECKDMNKIKNIISSYIISKYSFDYISILLKMIEIDENKREDFIQLENSIRD